MRKIKIIFFIVVFLNALTGIADEYELLQSYLQDKIEKGMTQAIIAKDLDVAPSTVSNFVRGVTTTSPKMLKNFKKRCQTEYQTLTNQLSVTTRPIAYVELMPEKINDVVLRDTTIPLVLPKIPSPLVSNEVNLQEEDPKVVMVSFKPSHIKALITESLNIDTRQSPVVIAYRQEGKEQGKGAFYDHYTIQRLTQHPTLVSLPIG